MFLTACVISAFRSNAPDRHDQRASAIEEDDSPGRIDFTGREWREIAAPYPLIQHTSTPLNEGTVVVAGGVSLVNTEELTSDASYVFDPFTGSWSLPFSMNQRRAGHVTIGRGWEAITIGGLSVVDGTNPRSECAGDAVCQAGACASPAPCDGQPDGTVCGEGKVCQAGECVTPVAACSEDGTLCAEGDGCTVGICRDGACIDTYRLDGTRCEGGICIAGKCRLDPTPASDEEVGFDGGIGSGDATSNGGTNGSSSASEDAEDGGGCSIGGRAHGSSPIATGLALLAAIGLMRRRGEKTHSHVDRG